jgi:hypothetical protein
METEYKRFKSNINAQQYGSEWEGWKGRHKRRGVVVNPARSGFTDTPEGKNPLERTLYSLKLSIVQTANLLTQAIDVVVKRGGEEDILRKITHLIHLVHAWRKTSQEEVPELEVIAGIHRKVNRSQDIKTYFPELHRRTQHLYKLARGEAIAKRPFAKPKFTTDIKKTKETMRVVYPQDAKLATLDKDIKNKPATEMKMDTMENWFWQSPDLFKTWLEYQVHVGLISPRQAQGVYDKYGWVFADDFLSTITSWHRNPGHAEGSLQWGSVVLAAVRTKDEYQSLVKYYHLKGLLSDELYKEYINKYDEKFAELEKLENDPEVQKVDPRWRKPSAFKHTPKEDILQHMSQEVAEKLIRSFELRQSEGLWLHDIKKKFGMETMAVGESRLSETGDLNTWSTSGDGQGGGREQWMKQGIADIEPSTNLPRKKKKLKFMKAKAKSFKEFMNEVD